VPSWDLLLGGFVGGGIAAGLGLWWGRRHREPWPELMDLEDRVTKAEHRSKMTQGRLNQIAPPRAGTGEDSVAPAAAQGHPQSRAELLRDFQRKQKGA